MLGQNPLFLFCCKENHPFTATGPVGHGVDVAWLYVTRTWRDPFNTKYREYFECIILSYG
jgi:hypothetical protein